VRERLALAEPVAGHVHLIGAADAAEVTAAVPGCVDEGGGAAGPAAGAQPGAAAVVDDVGQTGGLLILAGVAASTVDTTLTSR
jgi:hypothetical protein